MDKPWISKDILLSVAAEKGYEISERQLERWRKADLLPRSKRIPMESGKGTRSIYPPAAIEQLRALCRLHFRHGPERRLDALRLALWWEGFPVPLPALKRTFEKLAVAPLERRRKELKQTGADALETSEKVGSIISAAPLRRGPGTKGFLNMVRRAFSSQADKESFFTALFQLFLGEKPPFQGNRNEADTGELSLGQIMERGLKVEAGSTCSVGDAKPWLATSGYEAFEILASFTPASFAQAVKAASEPDLIQAREDLRVLFGIGLIARVLRQITGRDIFGAKVWEALNQAQTPLGHATCIAFLLWLRKKKGMGDKIDQLTTCIRGTQSQYMAMEAILNIGPNFTKFLDPKKGKTVYCTAPPKETERFRVTVAQVLSSHPQLAAALTDMAKGNLNET